VVRTNARRTGGARGDVDARPEPRGTGVRLPRRGRAPTAGAVGGATRRTRIAAIALAACLTIAAAQPYVWPDDWSNLPSAEVRRGGTVQLTTTGDPRTFNPLVSVEVNIVVLGNTGPEFGAAVLGWQRPGDAAWEPRGARSWTISEDGRTIDVELRDGVAWSDGTPITIDDYLISYELQTNPDTGGGRYDGWFVDGERILLEATGERSLRLTFPGPDRLAYTRLAALWPLPERIFGEAFRSGGAEAVRALWGIDTDPADLVFSGARRLSQVVLGEQLVFEANPHFGAWNVDASGNPLPYVDRTVFRNAEADAAINLFLAGQLDQFGPRNLDEVGVILAAVEAGDIDAVVFESAYATEGLQFVSFNWNRSSDPFKERLFRDGVFRRAMAHLVDRETIIDLVFTGAAVPLATGVSPSYGPWLHEALEPPAYDPERAADLLQELGFTTRDADGYLVDPDGRRASFSIMTIAGASPLEQIVQIFQDSAREVGVEVIPEPLAFPLLVDRLTTTGDDRPWDAVLIALTASGSSWPFLDGLYGCTGAFHLFNRSGSCLDPLERRIAELVRLGRRTLDDEEARRIGREIQELEMDLQGVIFTVAPAAHGAVSGRLAGYLPEELRGPPYGFAIPLLISLR
jgi:peptide/nickel transport system substrate-binding protein